MKDNSKYQNCPMCGSLCAVEGDKEEGTHYYAPLCDNAKVHTEYAGLRAFVAKVAQMDVLQYDYLNTSVRINNPLQAEAKALLQRTAIFS